MSQTFEFYSERADDAAAEAKLATLDNVRERCLRAENTWRGLANQARRTLVQRQKADAARMAKRIEEAEAANAVAAV